MLDKLSPQLRHTLILTMGALLGVLTEELPNYNLPTMVAPFVGVLLTQLTLHFTKLTKQYGKK
jgi:hypothetical protein